eukprot:SAG11_NODE_1106_length_5841_cov_44.770986_3_plen_149_part_00
MTEDQDSDANHPFLLLWPEIYLIVCSLIDPATRRNGESPTDMELGTVPAEVLNAYAKWAVQEEKLNSWEYESTAIENSLFLLKRVTVSNKDCVQIEIEKADYIKDTRWKELYEYLRLTLSAVRIILPHRSHSTAHSAASLRRYVVLFL